MLRKAYNWILEFSNHPKATWILAAVSFAESSFFPIPPDPLYISMILGRHKDAWRLAAICTLSSVIGGLLGYYIGYALYESIGEWIISAYSLQSAFDKFQTGFTEWGFWIVALKGLTPIPYKVVTIFSGVVQLNLLTFVVASCIARGFRFYIIAALLRYCGPSVKTFIDNNLNLVALIAFLALVGGFLVLKHI